MDRRGLIRPIVTHDVPVPAKRLVEADLEHDVLWVREFVIDPTEFDHHRTPIILAGRLENLSKLPGRPGRLGA